MALPLSPPSAWWYRVFQTPEIFPELSLLENVMIQILAKRDGAFKLSLFRRFASEQSVRIKAEDILEDLGLGSLIFWLLEVMDLYAILADDGAGDVEQMLMMGQVEHLSVFGHFAQYSEGGG